jgi:chromosome partitioning protein
MRRIAIVNQKGGCGKTTTAVSLALCLKDLGQKVLLTDMDPQGSTTQCLCPDKESIEHTVYDLLVDSDSLPISTVLTEIDSDLALLPANVVLSTAEQMLAGRERREERLKQVLDRIPGDYDFVIIDSPPNIGLLTFNALMAADEVIIPVDPSLFSLHGIGRVTEALELLRKVNNHDTSYKVLATMYDSRTRISRELLSTLKTRYEDSCFETVIRSNITLRESTGYGVPITHYRASRGFYDYCSLANEVLGNDPTQKSIAAAAIENYLAPRRIGGGILFSYVDGEAGNVLIEGDFNSWDGSSDVLLDVDGRGLWQRVIALRRGQYKYRYVADGIPAADPNNGRTEYIEGRGLVSVAEV